MTRGALDAARRWAESGAQGRRLGGDLRPVGVVPARLQRVTRTVGRRGALLALGCAAVAPLVVVSGIAVSIAMDESWVFLPAVAAFALLDRVSSRYVDAFDEETGSSSDWYAWGSRRYLRHYADRARVDWRFPAGGAWLGAGLLVAFFVFLCVHAVWDFATPGAG